MGEAVRVNGTRVWFERTGAGQPLLIIHGAGEDAVMLAAQADALAAADFDVITYDRRGTGRSGRDDWPGTGAEQHAEDAAGLLAALVDAPATVLGLSSGAVVALVLAARRPDLIANVIAWEAPAVGVVPGGAEAAAAMMAPVHTHLAAHPGDWAGAQAVMLAVVSGGETQNISAGIRANAEAMVRDDPAIVLAPVDAFNLRGSEVLIAVGDAPNPLVAAAATGLAELSHTTVTRISGDHEVYLDDPEPLTQLVVGAREAISQRAGARTP